ncbi:DUF1801 domain-containing protein [Sinisalibacter aestuarii]|uniref:DUF1801 domain-containing protein n=1 Tax=Sinisalibacter aestuarii TaxID=2949426 RepID=A0ABQ5LR71_9RHOB|nr:DUF1801 domain-containing protein [Sinisalibacter aestuarii]GKY87458.1 hypothetical protein STA1M1_13270 [Sinisalibacter aestuarii]
MDDWPSISAALVAVIRTALPEAVEDVKWNAPSFAIDGQHLVTLMRPKHGGARVVLHRDAKAVDTKTGTRLLAIADSRLRWATDQRAQIGFASLAEVEAGADWLAGLVRDWVRAARD